MDFQIVSPVFVQTVLLRETGSVFVVAIDLTGEQLYPAFSCQSGRAEVLRNSITFFLGSQHAHRRALLLNSLT